MENPKKAKFMAFDGISLRHQKYKSVGLNFTDVYAHFQPCPILREEDEYSLYGPVIRDYFSLNYIVRGRGIATLNGIEHPIHEGQIYVTFPGTTIMLYTECPDYWEYYAMYFKSANIAKYLRAMNFSEITPVFPYENIPELLVYFNRLIDMYNEGDNNPFDKTINVCQIFSTLTKFASKHDENNVFESANNLMERALQFFEINYSSRISISDVANALGLNRSYFSRVFKQHMDISPQEYLIRLRIKKACEFLTEPSVSISNVAYSVGYEPFTFSRTFKQITGFSPSEYHEKFKR